MSRAREDDANDVAQQRPRKRQNTTISTGDQSQFKYHHPGFIQTVECINFMCHKNLKINVGPGITFVSGQNGHGKSAILTALIQVFSTDRKMKGERGTGSALRRNIEGNQKAKSAKIIVTIHNKKADDDLDLTDGGVKGYTMRPFEPDTYGDVIIIEREIFEKARKLKIMSEDKTVISERNEVLLHIMRHFAYQFDNRLVIQTQENAKKRGDPKSLFDFFYNGSGFESMDNDIKKLNQEVLDQLDCLSASLAPTVDAKKTIRDRLKTELEATEHTKTLHDDLQRYEAMSLWLNYSLYEKKLNHVVDTKVKYEAKHAQLKEVHEKRKATLEAQKRELDELKDYSEFDDKLGTINSKLAQLKTQQTDNKLQVQSSKRDVEEIRDQIKDLDKTIDKLRAKRDQKDTDSRHEKADALIQEWQEKLDAAEREVASCKSKVQEKEEQVSEIRSRASEAYQAQNSKESKLREAKEQASRKDAMFKDKGNPIAVFGRDFIEADRVIQANMSKFKLPPLGPLGQYVKLKRGTSEHEKTLINNYNTLTSALKAYVVADAGDERTLRSLLPRGFKPVIYRVKPDNYNVESVSPDPRFKTILRCLDISEPRVTQALVEWVSINTVGIANSTDEAVSTLKQSHHHLESMLAPHRTSERYIVLASQRGTSLSSSEKNNMGVLQEGKVTVSAEEVDEAKRRAQALERELAPLEEKAGQFKSEENEARRELRAEEDRQTRAEARYHECRKKHVYALSEKDSIPDAPSTDETDQAIEAKTEERSNCEAQLEVTESALNESQELGRKIAEKVAAAQEEMAEIKAQKQEAVSKYDAVNDQYTAHQDVMTSTLQKLELAEKKIAEKEQQLDECQKSMKESHKAAQLVSPDRVPLDEGVEFEQGPDHCEAMKRTIQAKINAARQNNIRDYRTVYSEYSSAQSEYEQAVKVYKEQKRDIDALKVTGEDRKVSKQQALSLGVMQTAAAFQNIMRTKAASAEIVIDTEIRRLDVKNYRIASSSGEASQDSEARDVATTSGGEHSFLQAALMSALWKLVDAPIICLDEYEVFMDDATRVSAQKNLVNALGSLNQRAQAILISPTVVKNSARDDPRFKYVEVRDPSVVNSGARD